MDTVVVNEGTKMPIHQEGKESQSSGLPQHQALLPTSMANCLIQCAVDYDREEEEEFTKEELEGLTRLRRK